MTVYCVKYAIYKSHSDDGPFTLIAEDGSGTWNDPATAIAAALSGIRELGH